MYHLNPPAISKILLIIAENKHKKQWKKVKITVEKMNSL